MAFELDLRRERNDRPDSRCGFFVEVNAPIAGSRPRRQRRLHNLMSVRELRPIAPRRHGDVAGFADFRQPAIRKAEPRPDLRDWFCPNEGVVSFAAERFDRHPVTLGVAILLPQLGGSDITPDLLLS